MAKVYAGLSGGVDSALACALLCEAGHDVTAVYMRNWSRDLPGFKCAWADDLADAERVAVSLGIDLEVWDCEAEYKATVVDYLVDAYEIFAASAMASVIWPLSFSPSPINTNVWLS